MSPTNLCLRVSAQTMRKDMWNPFPLLKIVDSLDHATLVLPTLDTSKLQQSVTLPTSIQSIGCWLIQCQWPLHRFNYSPPLAQPRKPATASNARPEHATGNTGPEFVTGNTKRGKRKQRKLQKVDPSILGKFPPQLPDRRLMLLSMTQVLRSTR